MLIIYFVETCGGGRDRPWRGLSHCIQARRSIDGEDSSDGGEAVSDPLNSQWGKVRGIGMEGLPLPELRHRSTWLVILLWWLWVSLYYLSRPGLQKGRLHNGESQRSSIWDHLTFRKGLQPPARAWQTQYLHRSRRGGKGGKSEAKGKGTEAPPTYEKEKNGDLLIRDLWIQETDIIHNMRVVNTAVVSYQWKPPEKCLEPAECKKKKKYINACLNERRKLTTLVTLVGGLLYVKSEETLTCIATVLAQKWKEP